MARQFREEDVRRWPARSPDSRGGEFAPKAPSWIVRASGRMRPAAATPGQSTPRRPRVGRPGRPRNAQVGLPRVSDQLARGSWGVSHGMSYAITGESAALMGIRGFRRAGFDDTLEEWDAGYSAGTLEHQAIATRFLRTIYEGSQPSPVRRFHGTAGPQWADVRPGQTIDLPLTATAPNRGTVTYGMDHSGERDGPDAPPAYLIVFPKGVATAGISHEWDENGDYRLPTWNEAVVAGRFRVKARHDVRTPGIGYYTRIELEPTEVYDPTRRRWVPPRRRLRAGHDFGEHQQLVDELRDGGARVHPDGTVSVWRVHNISEGSGWEYTTNGEMAIERAGWRNEPEPEEVRLPLSQVRLLYQYSDETRLAIPGQTSSLLRTLLDTPSSYDEVPEIVDWAQEAGLQYGDQSGVRSVVRSGSLVGDTFRRATVAGDFKAPDGSSAGSWSIEFSTDGSEVRLFVDALALHAGHGRGQGVGRRWAQRLEEIARQAGVTRIDTLDTSGGFWTHLGYQKDPTTGYTGKDLR